jgi:cob(I)alamin adenosyltransferase
VSRRLERRAGGMCADGELDNDNLIVWLNRLSDYLYLLARSAEDKPTLVKSE